jgi:tRNA-splicing ligase RtcB
MGLVALGGGMAVVAGILLIAGGWCRQPPRPYRRRRSVDLPLERLLAAGGGGLVTLVLTRWPVAASGMAAGGWFVAGWWQHRGEPSAERKAEALALWVEMLRDTVGTAKGLEGVIAVTASTAPPLIRPEIVRVAARLQDNVPLDRVLVELAEALDHPVSHDSAPPNDHGHPAVRNPCRPWQERRRVAVTRIANAHRTVGAVTDPQLRSADRGSPATSRPTSRTLPGPGNSRLWPRPPTTGGQTGTCSPWLPAGRSRRRWVLTVWSSSTTCPTTWPSSRTTRSAAAGSCSAFTASARPGLYLQVTPDLPPDLAGVGQPVLVPGSMGTASHLLLGVAGGDAFHSTCHDAGRAMSRTAARKRVSGAALQRELEAAGSAVRAGSRRGLAEEAPFSYKDVDAVVAAVDHAGLARRVARLIPLGVLKG